MGLLCKKKWEKWQCRSVVQEEVGQVAECRSVVQEEVGKVAECRTVVQEEVGEVAECRSVVQKEVGKLVECRTVVHCYCSLFNTLLKVLNLNIFHRKCEMLYII